MTISIEPTDFGQDILDSISPLLGAFGLLGSDGYTLKVEAVFNLQDGVGVQTENIYENLTTTATNEENGISFNEW